MPPQLAEYPVGVVTKASRTSETPQSTRILSGQPNRRRIGSNDQSGKINTSVTLTGYSDGPLGSASPAADVGRSASPWEPSALGHGLNAAVPPSSSHEWLRPRLGYWSCSRSLSKPPSFFKSMPAVFSKVLTLSGRSWIGASVLQIDLSSSPSARL